MIDWARVIELRDEIGPDSFDEVALLFLEEADDAVEQLSAAQSATALESALHFLKGSALNLGFRELARLCQVGEKTAASGATLIDIVQIKTAYDVSKSAFQSGRGQMIVAGSNQEF